MRISVINSMGLDSVSRTFPALRILRENYPHSEITYFSWDKYRPLLSHMNEYIDNIRSIDPAGLVNILLSELSADIKYKHVSEQTEQFSSFQGQDLLINFSGEDEAGLVLSTLIKAKSKKGPFLAGSGETAVMDIPGAFSHASGLSRRFNRFNRTDVNNLLTGCMPFKRVYRPHIKLNSESDDKVMHLFHEAGINPGKEKAGIIAGSPGENSFWGVENFSLLADMLASKFNLDIILIGRESEHPSAEQIRIQARNSSIYNFSGLVDDSMLLSLVSKLRMVISGGHDYMYSSSLLNVPAVYLGLGCCHFREQGPYQSNCHIITPAMDCFPCREDFCCSHANCRKIIRPEYVYQIAKSIISGSDIPSDEIKQMKSICLYRGAFTPSGIIDYEPVEAYDIEKNDLISILMFYVWERILGLNDKNNNAIGYIKRNYRFLFDPDLLEQMMLLRIDTANMQNRFGPGINPDSRSFSDISGMKVSEYFEVLKGMAGILCRSKLTGEGGSSAGSCDEELGFIRRFLSIFLEKTDNLIDSIKQIIGIDV